jgi:mannose-1-phosphate guanylyltransferase
MATHAVVLAGGSGTRFWPASRRAQPKQLLSLSADPRSLLAQTLARVESLCPIERSWVVTGTHLATAIRAELPRLSESALLLEPEAKNTALSVGWAAAAIQAKDPEALVMVLPSDQHVADAPAYLGTLQRALESAAQGEVTTVGITPTRAETGYGYIETGGELGPSLLRGVRFTEKPNQALAEEYVRGGRHYWNSGMFFFRAVDMLQQIERHLPKLHAALPAMLKAGSDTAALRAIFAGLDSVSIDYGVMEKLPSFRVVAGDFGWSDLGSWQVAWELGKQDERENVAVGHAVFVDASGNLVYDLRRKPEQRTVALVGVQGVCVIVTDDAVLVIPRERAQEVRAVVDELSKAGKKALL